MVTGQLPPDSTLQTDAVMRRVQAHFARTKEAVASSMAVVGFGFGGGGRPAMAFVSCDWNENGTADLRQGDRRPRRRCSPRSEDSLRRPAAGSPEAQDGHRLRLHAPDRASRPLWRVAARDQLLGMATRIRSAQGAPQQDVRRRAVQVDLDWEKIGALGCRSAQYSATSPLNRPTSATSSRGRVKRVYARAADAVPDAAVGSRPAPCRAPAAASCRSRRSPRAVGYGSPRLERYNGCRPSTSGRAGAGHSLKRGDGGDGGAGREAARGFDSHGQGSYQSGCPPGRRRCSCLLGAGDLPRARRALRADGADLDRARAPLGCQRILTRCAGSSTTSTSIGLLGVPG